MGGVLLLVRRIVPERDWDARLVHGGAARLQHGVARRALSHVSAHLDSLRLALGHRPLHRRGGRHGLTGAARGRAHRRVRKAAFDRHRAALGGGLPAHLHHLGRPVRRIHVQHRAQPPHHGCLAGRVGLTWLRLPVCVSVTSRHYYPLPLTPESQVSELATTRQRTRIAGHSVDFGRSAMSKTVMIVEDNELNMKLFHDLLEAHGYNTVGTRNGIEALDLARKHHPDLILMDIQLPEVSGLEVTKWLKEDAELKAIPVVAVTAFAMRGDEERIREAGCEAYLSKPIPVPQFIETIRRFLGVGLSIPAR